MVKRAGNTSKRVVAAGGMLACVGCNVASTGESTGGVQDGSRDSDCPAGVAVVLTDFFSTQIALSDLEGETQSASFISTASTETDGLAFALSGDVALPSAPVARGRLVLLDRFATNVITWVDTATAEVVAQLPVGTGFESNPQDYVEVGGRAFVSRWGQNVDPGKEDFDTGGDILVVDPDVPAIVDSIVLPTADDLPARPGALLHLGGEILVTLERVALDFGSTGEAMIVGVSPEEQAVTWQQTLTGFKACGRLELSPDGERLALACTGGIDSDGVSEDLSQSALILFDAHDRPLREVQRFPAEEIAGEPLQNAVTFVDDETVLLKTQTPWGGETHNRWLAFHLEREEPTELLQAGPGDDGAGQGLVYGGMACAPGCSDHCLLADGDAGVLQRVRAGEDGALELLDPIQVEDRVGLPPIGLSHR